MPSTSAAGNAQNPDMFVTIQRWGRCNFLFLQRSDKVLGFQSNSVKMKFQMRRRSYVRAANAIHKQQEHYSVLGLRRNASSADIKKAYRRLARQYHPDVNKSPSAGNSFQSVRLAYEVLSTDSLRAKYDTMLKLGELENRRAWINYSESDLNRQRREAWAETNQHAQTREKADFYNYSESFSSSYEDHEDEEIIYDLWQRVVLVRIFSIIFVPKLFFPMSIIAGLLNRQMSAAYKFAHIVACFIGGSVGFFLLFALPFARRFYRTIYGKYSDNLLAGILFSIWVGTNVARVAPVPQGAILGFTYMSYKMQLEVIKE